MHSHLCHALTLRLAEISSETIPSSFKDVLGDFPTKRQLQTSIQYLHISGLLVMTEDGYVPTDTAKTLGCQNVQERYSKQSISELAVLLEKHEKFN